jgi:purine-binding chemotaxis protein CheW
MNTIDAPAPATHAGKFLTVVLNGEAYGLKVLKVREIIRLQKITAVPQMPVFVKGVINLRGRVIPVIDLRVRFNLPAEITDRTCIVVSEICASEARPIQIGLIVDSVEDVVNVTASEIEPPPDFGSRLDTAYLHGLAKVKGQLKMLLDLDRIVAAQSIETPLVAPAVLPDDRAGQPSP